MKTTEQYVPLVLFIMLYKKGVPLSGSVDEIIQMKVKKTIEQLLSFAPVYCAIW